MHELTPYQLYQLLTKLPARATWLQLHHYMIQNGFVSNYLVNFSFSYNAVLRRSIAILNHTPTISDEQECAKQELLVSLKASLARATKELHRCEWCEDRKAVRIFGLVKPRRINKPRNAKEALRARLPVSRYRSFVVSTSNCTMVSVANKHIKIVNGAQVHA